jgi:3'(2'), 5'-bisphosphate nucleotidase
MRYVSLTVGGGNVMLRVPIKKNKRSYVWDHAGGHLIFREARAKSVIWIERTLTLPQGSE